MLTLMRPRVGVLALSVLVGFGLMGCGSTLSKSVSSSGWTAACQTVRTTFHKWYEDWDAADTAARHANNQWIKESNAASGLLRGQALTDAINAYNPDLQVAKMLRAKASQEAAGLNLIRARCNEARIPRACRAEFAQYKPIMDNRAAQDRATAAIEDAIAAEQQASQRGSGSAFNDAGRALNTAVEQLDDLQNTSEISLMPALNRAIEACNNAG